MNIGFDAAAMFSASSKNRGIGNYSVSLFKTLIKNDKENRYFLLNCMDGTPFAPYLDGETENFYEEMLYSGANCQFFRDGYDEIFGDILRTFLARNKIDVFIITSPFEMAAYIYRREWFEGVTVCGIVYDIIPYIMRDKYLSQKTTYSTYMRCVDALRFCDRLMVISESVRDDLVRYLGFDSSKIDVIYGAYDSHFKKIKISSAEKAALYSKFGVRDGFIMCTGGDDDRKNIDGLIRAYSAMPKELIAKHQLVVVCKLGAGSVKRYTELAARLGIKDRLVLTNFVSVEELIKFYNLAYLMAFPSKYEGFGLPVVEAWACGTPVLTSINSSLGEFGEDCAVLVNPFNTEDVTSGLVRALTSGELDKMLTNGQKRLEELYNWDKVAELTRLSLARCEIGESIAENERKRLAFFTPLPPIQSGIADYSLDVINSLSEYFDIDVFIDDGYVAECALANGVSVFPHGDYEAKRQEYFETLYQMGNSEFHVYMYKYIERFGGTLVLHDYNMNGIAAHLRANGEIGIFEKFVFADYSGDKAVDLIVHGVSDDSPLNGLVVEPCHRIIVHDKYSKERLLRRNFGKKVFVIPHYAKPETQGDVKALRKKYGYGESDLIFAAFGIIAETKRIIPLLDAFAAFHRSNPDSRLLLCGKPAGDYGEILQQRLEYHALGDSVRITGYTELDEFLEYIDICDLCFNLRYPYNGESSGSLARILAKGKPVVVNRIGSFDSVPDRACIKLPDVAELSEDEEVQIIQNVMERFVDSSESFSRIAAEGKRYATEELDIVRVAVQYRDALNSPVRAAFSRDVSLGVLNLIRDGEYSEKELRELSHTFAYAKDEGGIWRSSQNTSLMK